MDRRTSVPSLSSLCLYGGRGRLTWLLNPAAALAAPPSVLRELAENEGLAAGRLRVASGCLNGGSRRFLFAAARRARARPRNHWKREYPGLDAARGRPGSGGRPAGRPRRGRGGGAGAPEGFAARVAAARLEVVRAGAARRRQPGRLQAGLERESPSARLGNGCTKKGTSGPGGPRNPGGSGPFGEGEDAFYCWVETMA